ncbi:hypothetical protein KI387_044632, partial [Taxus chinensis]
IPEHKKRAFEYLGLKEEKTTPSRNVNIVETPPQFITDLVTPPALEDLGEAPEVYLGTSLVDSQLNFDPFFTTLIINDRLFHNCMFDSGASCNVMPLEVMNELDIKLKVAYGKCTAMDSREVLIVGCVKGLVVQLAAYSGKNLKLDVVIVDYPAKWGMLMSRKWAASVGGSIQMDMYFSTIPIEGSLVKLYGEKKMLHLIEDPNNASYEVLFVDVDADNFIGFADGKEKKMDQSKFLEVIGFPWTLLFDGDFSKFGNGAGIVLLSPSLEEFVFSFKLNFECSNNIVEYEALLSGLRISWKYGVKDIISKGYSDIVVKQIRKLYAIKNQRMK